MKKTLFSLIFLSAMLPGIAIADVCPSEFMPPIDKMNAPSVAFSVKVVPMIDIVRLCGTSRAYACSWPVGHDWTNHLTKPWKVVIADTLPINQQSCALTYEESHMPPNNYIDSKMETWSAWDQVIKNAPRNLPDD